MSNTRSSSKPRSGVFATRRGATGTTHSRSDPENLPRCSACDNASFANALWATLKEEHYLSSHPDFGHHGHPQSQDVLGVLALFEYDLDRNPLHNFDVVSCGILGRQEAEEGPGGPADAENMTLIGATVRVNRDSGGLSGPHALELRLLEVGRYPDVLAVERDDG